MTSSTDFILGINIGGTSCSLVAATAAGKIRDRRAWATEEARDPEDTVRQIVRLSREMLGGTFYRGAGVAIGGPLDTRTGTVLGPPNLPGWEEVRLKEKLEGALGLPVLVMHDAAACALAEAVYGNHPEGARLVYLTCGTGFGAGIVEGGKPMKGTAGVHPEIGHWQLLAEGPEAFGRAGSAEAFCSGRGFTRIAAWRYPERWGKTPPEPEEITRLAREGDTEALGVVDFQCRMTGRVCAMVAELICPDRILLGSLATHLGTFWVDRVQNHYRSEVLERIGSAVDVLPCRLGERLQDLSAVAVGVAAAAGD